MSLYVKLRSVSKSYSIGNSAASELISAMSEAGEKHTERESKLAVDNVTLSLREGDRLGIVGRNGAGKSTLLHMIASIADPTSGEIQIEGKVTSIMTLGLGLREELSGRENIYVDGGIHGKTREDIDKLIDRVIEFSELGKFMEYPVRTYSTGMKARLAFSMIAHVDPEILIIDEALSVGDAAFSVKATKRIREICEKGKIVILVSHGMQAIRDICNRCIYLKDGKIVMDGSPTEVTNAYIDEVRAEDEAALVAKFEDQVGNRSWADGYRLDRIKLLSGHPKSHSVRIEATQDLTIQISAVIQEHRQELICRVDIVRLDDLLLFRQEFLTKDYCLSHSKLGMQLEFEKFPLAPAIYRLDVTLLEREEQEEKMLAESSTIFETYSMNPPLGGKPMLYYPTTGKSTVVQ
jgi:lipopolysaccharide transport system ATP-binding protein